MRRNLPRALTLAASVLCLSGQVAPPAIISLQPNRTDAGSAQFTMFVTGTLYGRCAKVQWNRADLPSQATPNGLTATVAASLVASPGIANVRIFDYRDLENTCSTTTGTPSAEVEFFINALPLTWITAPTLPAAVAGVAYSTTLSATGGVAPVRYALAPGSSLPSGLTLSAAGLLSGTLSGPGTFQFTVRATDSCEDETPFCNPASADRRFTLTATAAVTSTLNIVTSALQQGRVGQSYSQQLLAQGGTQPYTWTITAGALPPGINLQNNTGVLFGAPAFPGEFIIQVTVRDAANGVASRTLPLSVASSITILTESLPPATVGRFYSFAMSVTGGAVPFRFEAVNLPAGMAMDQFGTLTGVPQFAGLFQVTIRATDAAGVTTTRTYPLTVNDELRFLTQALVEGRVGILYNQTLAAIGGRPPYLWTVVGPVALPPGINLNINSGQLLGTPTQAGDFDLLFRVSDQAGNQVDRVLRIAVRPSFTITTTALPAGSAGTPYSLTLGTSGGRAPVQWRVTLGSFPQGMSLDGAAGSITGTPVQSGTFSIELAATDAAGVEARRSFTLLIRERLQIVPPLLPPGTTGTAYQQTVSLSGSQGTVTWVVADGSLPDGLQLAPDGAIASITGTPSREGRFAFTLRATDSTERTASQPYVVRVAAALRLLTESLPAGGVGASYRAALAAEGGDPPYQWSILTGTIPPGVGFEGTGVFSGTPSAAGTFRFTAEVRDDAGRAVSRQLAIEIAPSLTVNPGSLPSGIVGVPYRQLFSADEDATWQVSQGTLPAGLTLSAAGVLSGVPQRAGSSTFTVRASAAGGVATGSRQYTVAVGALEVPAVNIAPGDAGAAQQPAVSVNLGAPAPVELQGLVRLTFAPESGPPDPAVRFSMGDGTTARFTVPAGQTQAQFPAGLAVQTGTVAGVITLTLELTANGVAVTPAPAPTRTIRIARAAPVINSVTAVRSATGITVEIIAFSTAREVTSGEFQFTVPGQAGSNFTLQLAQAVATWYADARSREFGSLFKLTLPFTASGTPATQVAVTLINSLGRSETRTANVQ